MGKMTDTIRNNIVPNWEIFFRSFKIFFTILKNEKHSLI